MKKIFLVGLVVIAMLLSGCAYGPEPGVTPTPMPSPAVTPTPAMTPQANETETTPVAEDAVEIRGFAFNPAELTVSRGTTVAWTQMDAVSHTVTGPGFESGRLSQGQSFRNTFNEAGTFDYICSIHPYMRGRIIVT